MLENAAIDFHNVVFFSMDVSPATGFQCSSKYVTRTVKVLYCMGTFLLFYWYFDSGVCCCFCNHAYNISIYQPIYWLSASTFKALSVISIGRENPSRCIHEVYINGKIIHSALGCCICCSGSQTDPVKLSKCSFLSELPP